MCRETKANLEITTADLEHKTALYNNMRRDHEELELRELSLKRRCQTFDDDLAAGKQEISGLKSSIATLASHQAGIQAELEAVKVMTGWMRFLIKLILFICQLYILFSHSIYCVTGFTAIYLYPS